MKKVVFLSAVLALVVATYAGGIAYAQENAATVERINQLLKQIQELQKQIETLRAQQVQAAGEVSGLLTTLQEGSRGEKVKVLQALLAADVDVYPEGLLTGYYGKLTAKAVKNYQKKHGIEQVGVVGPKTLAKLNKELESHPLALEDDDEDGRGDGKRPCAIVPPGHLIAPGWLRKNEAPVVPLCQTLPPGIKKKIDDDEEKKNAPVILSLSPASGAIGTVVTITGSRFTPTENTVHFGSGALIGFASTASGTIITFGVPSALSSLTSTSTSPVVPGTYLVSVTNTKGTSNSKPFTVTATSTSQPQLSISQNTSIGTPTAGTGTTNVKIGSYLMTAGAGEGVGVTSITMGLSTSSPTFTNLKLFVDGTQLGVTQSVTTPGASYTFSGSVNVPAAQTKTIDVRADIPAGVLTGSYATVTTLSSCAATGLTSLLATTCTSTAGQNLVVATQATLQVSADAAASPASNQLVMGSSGNALAAFRFTETSNVEDLKITDLYVFQTVADTATVKSSFSALSLSHGSILAGTAGTPTTYAQNVNPGPGYYYKFSLGTPVVIPRASSITLTLKGDVSSFVSGGASDQSVHTFKILTTADAVNDASEEVVVARGNTSNILANVALSGTQGNPMTVVRSKAGISFTLLGVSTSRAKSAADDLGNLVFTADAAGPIAINQITLTFGGTAPANAAFLDGVNLLDENANSLGSGNTTSSPCTGSNTCTKTFHLGAGVNGQVVSAGASRSFVLRANSLQTAAGIAGIAQNLAVSINAANDVLSTDGLDAAATTNIPLPSTIVPIALPGITYAIGT